MGLFKSTFASLARARGSAAERPDAKRSDPSAIEPDWRALVEAGRLPDALGLVDLALATAPDDTTLRIARVDVLRAWGRDAEATLEIRRNHANGIPDAELARRQAWAAMRTGNADEAIACHQRVLASEPTDIGSTSGIGAALLALGRFDEAIACFRIALPHAAGDPTALLGWGSCELGRKRPSEAEVLFRQAIDIAPRSAAAYENLGIALAAMNRHGEAFEALSRADELARSSGEAVDAYANIGIWLCEVGNASEGVRVLVDGLRERPNLNGFLQLGPALLSLGDFREGWRHFEHRWLVEPLASKRADYGVPQWMGQPLEGRTILVRAEQGLGDIFQFVRYLPRLKALGAHVIFQPLKGTDRIARRFAGIDRIAEDGERLPDFDYYANLMSLPLAFGTTATTIPSEIPYLSPDPAFSAKWAPRLAKRDRPRVGLAWAGRPEHRADRLRSLHLDWLVPILEVEGVRFVSLQKGPAASQAERVAERIDWEGVGPELDELDDAAAVVSELDLLISVDSGLAHLAGAMGKPVWVMLQTPSEYRWMTGRDDTPWYPTMRLFRQETPRHWDPVVARVAASLRNWVAEWQGAARRTTTLSFEPVPWGDAARYSDESRCKGVAIAVETRSGFLQFIPDEPRIGRSLEHCGEWLQARLDLALRFVRSGAVIIEAGAGAGAHTLPLARAAGDDGVVLAYESRPAFRRLLAQNLAAHRLANATVMTRALGAEGFADDRETVDALQLARLDGIKVNEGADSLGTLRGASETLWRCRPWLLLAEDDRTPLDAGRNALREFGYRAWRVETPLHSSANFNRRTDDVFAGAKAVALFALPEEVDLRAPLPGCTEWK